MELEARTENTADRIVRFDPRLWLDETAHLTPLQKSVLLDLLCHRWLEGMLPMSFAELARLAGTTPQHIGQSWKKLDPLVTRGEWS